MFSKNAILTVVACILSVAIHSQDFQGVATYKSHRKLDLNLNEETSKNPELERKLQEQLRQQFQQEYTMIFNKNESIYRKNEQLERPNPIANGVQITVNDGSDLIYKNIKDQRFTNQTEIFGKQFLVKDNLSETNWELVNETKNIGEYTCFKATFSEPYTTQTISSEGTMESVEKVRTTIAWYAPQIPISNGPADFHGLPGLILEINDGELTLVCTKIVMNPAERLDIEEPKKGKEVTQEEYNVIMEKKNKELMEQFQSRQHDGERVMIRIGE